MFRNDACWRCSSKDLVPGDVAASVNCNGCFKQAFLDKDLTCVRCGQKCEEPKRLPTLNCQHCKFIRRVEEIQLAPPAAKRQKVVSSAAKRQKVVSPTFPFMVELGTSRTWFPYPDQTTYTGRDRIYFEAANEQMVYVALASEPQCLARHLDPEENKWHNYKRRLSDWTALTVEQRIEKFRGWMGESVCSGPKLTVRPVQPIVL